MANKSSFLKKVLTTLIVLLLVSAGIGVYYGYKFLYQPNVVVDSKKSTFIYIRTGATFDDVVNMLYENNIIVDKTSFIWLAEKKGYKSKVKPGRYRVKNKMTNNELVNLLKSGLQEPVQFTFNNVRTKEQLASRVSGKTEIDSAELVRTLNDDDYLKKYGMNKDIVMTMFIPTTYEFKWNTSIDEFMNKIAEEYKKFWNDERKRKAQQIGLSQSEVGILATIVQFETYVESERNKIAGVYMNRIRKGMPLQADPTLVYATGDFDAQRVLNIHKEFDSPYNTYKYKGLPPGPIGIPSKSAIDAVLNYSKHDYIYFCAKEDFSGCSNYSKTYEEHQKNASRYQKALNSRNILK